MAPRAMDRPRLVGWSSLCLERDRSLTPRVAVVGTAAPVSTTGGEARRCACLSDCARQPARPRASPPARVLRRGKRSTIRVPSVVSRSARVAPGRGTASTLVKGCFADLRTVLASASPRVFVRTFRGNVFSQRLVDDSALRLIVRRGRAMRRTDFCRLTSSYEYPRLVGSRCVTRDAPARSGRPPAPRQCDPLRRAARGRDGRCLPVAVRANRASDIPVASRRAHGRSRAPDPGGLPRSLPSRTRER
jgi:hypothetical protein